MLNKTIFQYSTWIHHDLSELLRDLNYLSCTDIHCIEYLFKLLKCNLEDEAIKQTILLNSDLNSLRNKFNEHLKISLLRK